MADGTSNRGPIKTQQPDGWTLCAGCPVRDEPVDGLYFRLMDLISERFPETMVQSTLRSRIVYLMQRIEDLGRPDTAEGEPPTDEELEVTYYNAMVAAKNGMTRRGLGSKTRRETAGRKAGIAAIGRLLRSRAALRVGGAQKDNG